MSTFTENLRYYANTRIARNTYFWLIVLIFVYDINSGTYVYNQSVYLWYKLACVAMLFAMTYINNLLLVPALLAKKKRIAYMLSASLLLFVTAAAYILVLKNMQVTYPEIHV